MTATPEIGPQEGEALVAQGALLLDVREPDEWAVGHAPGARHVALGTLPDRVGELPTDRRIVAVCRSGGRSARATEFLVAQGLDVVNLAGGMQAWADAGRPVVTDDGEPGAVA